MYKYLTSVLPPRTTSCFRFVTKEGSRRIARATFVSGPRHRSVTCSGKVRNSFTYVDDVHKVYLLYEPGYVIHCVGNLTEENSFAIMFEFPTGV
jgi:hypothetical protein